MWWGFLSLGCVPAGMTSVTIEVHNDDAGSVIAAETVTVAEGDRIERTVVVEDPQLTASVQSSGN